MMALNAHACQDGMGRDTHCDHDRIPGGREHVRVIVALVVLGELPGEELTGELGTEEKELSLLSLASQVILSCSF